MSAWDISAAAPDRGLSNEISDTSALYKH